MVSKRREGTVMSKKAVDIKAMLVYLAMVLLVLLIILPPVLRIMMPTDGTNEVEKTKELTALICKKQLLVNQTQYNISVNSSYESNGLSKVVFTYRSTPATEIGDVTGNVEPQTPVNENVLPATDPTQQTQGEVSPNTQTNLGDTTTQVPITTDIVQSEIQALKAIPGMAVEDGDNFTKLALTKEVAETFEENSPYLSYFQPINEQKAYFQSQGYSCQSMKN